MCGMNHFLQLHLLKAHQASKTVPPTGDHMLNKIHKLMEWGKRFSSKIQAAYTTSKDKEFLVLQKKLILFCYHFLY